MATAHRPTSPPEVQGNDDMTITQRADIVNTPQPGDTVSPLLVILLGFLVVSPLLAALLPEAARQYIGILVR